jgi:hypothetical protein
LGARKFYWTFGSSIALPSLLEPQIHRRLRRFSPKFEIFLKKYFFFIIEIIYCGKADFSKIANFRHFCNYDVGAELSVIASCEELVPRRKYVDGAGYVSK